MDKPRDPDAGGYSGDVHSVRPALVAATAPAQMSSPIWFGNYYLACHPSTVRRITALLRAEGWHCSHKRVERIWRR
ncbi:IS3 family transposase, partial [Teichococcus oryzae]